MALLILLGFELAIALKIFVAFSSEITFSTSLRVIIKNLPNIVK
jgi:hypothetical protein